MGAGLSHVLEHMLFKGTTTHGVSQIAHEIEAKGGYMNAYTSFEQTVFLINIPSENWQTAVDILADCMQHATIPQDELLKEKRVILREMAMGNDDPNRRAERMLWATNWPHPSEPADAKPDEARLLDLLLEWAPDDVTRRKILVDNPAELYGF